jgi:endonuclease G
MKTYLILFLLLTACSTQKITNSDIKKSASFSESLIDHKYFKISYDQNRRLARYVIYQMSAEQLSHKVASREDKFIADPLLKSRNIPYVLPSEYVRSGYDRGHLAPSADFTWSQEANDMTFVMSNMAPQSKNLNRDAWRRLEDKVRKWACGEKLVTVITGPVLVDNLPRLPSGLEIPQEFFKVVIDETPPVKVVAFLYHQTDKGDVLEERMIPLNSIEKMTGMAFNKEFPQIMKDEKLRRPASLNEWKEADCTK